MRTAIALTFLCLALSCGGKAVIDQGSGSGGGAQGSSGSGASGSTSGSSGIGVGPGAVGSVGSTNPVGSTGSGPIETCNDLTAALQNALGEATSCNSCDGGPDPCAYPSGVQLTDICACPVAINISNQDAAERATDAYEAWIDAGCGPFDCEEPCAVSSDPTCTDLGGCAGTCTP